MQRILKKTNQQNSKKRKRKEISEDDLGQGYHDSVDVDIVNLITRTVTSDDYFIPNKWPTPKRQRGPNCGLYALETGLRFCYPDVNVPPARKGVNKNAVSLRSVAKQKLYTSFGEILDIESLQKLAAHFNFTECEASYQEFQTKKDYIGAICNYLQKGGCVIVAADMLYGIPFTNNGSATHWALVFGYYYNEYGCRLLVANQGGIGLWSASGLFQSNEQLPRKNPLYNRYGFYHKKVGIVDNKEDYDRLPLPDKNLPNKRYSLDRTLDKFRFGLCYIPSSVPIASLEFDTASQTRRAKI